MASASDFGTVNRTNDGISSFSNFGPRLDDGDDNEWDELKPDIASYGSNIISATAAAGTSFPGAPRPEADTGYDEKDGTSMATPIASGIIALVREAAPSLTAFEVMDVIRNSSEIRDKPANTVSDRWHEKWGFGSIDASCAIDFGPRPAVCLPLRILELLPRHRVVMVQEIMSPSTNRLTIRGSKVILQQYQDPQISHQANSLIRSRYVSHNF